MDHLGNVCRLAWDGKEHVCQGPGERLGAAILDKDRVRGALFPDALTDYSAEQDQLCMRAILEAAAYLTERRRVKYIFFDGRTFSTRARLRAFCWRRSRPVHVGASCT